MTVSKKSKVGKEDESITEEYLKDHETYIQKYGDNAFVLIQVGSFHESYSTNTRGPNLQYISSLLNIICSRKDKGIRDINEKNPYMMGFPLVASQKFIQLLINNGYTVILKEQVTPPPNPQRKVTQIFSPGTYVDNIESKDANNIICIYLEEEKQKNGFGLLCSGMSSVDISTGKVYIHKSLSTESDKRLALDETSRFINTMNPREIIIYFQQNESQIKANASKSSLESDVGYNKEKIISYLDLDNRNCIFKEGLPKSTYKEIKFQNEFFGKIYGDTGILLPIEYLNLDEMDYEYTRLSLILLLDFAKDHNELLLSDIEKPQHYIDASRMKLGNNAIYQLNIVEDNVKVTKGSRGIGSLFDVVNNTSTAMGYRLLKDRLVSPIVSHETLNKMYDHTEIILKDKFYLELEENLSGISDIERFNVKMILKRLQPFELVTLTESLNEANKMFTKIMKFQEKNKNININGLIPDNETMIQINEFIKLIDKTFVISELKKYSMNNITDTFFIKGIHKDVDKISSRLKKGLEFMIDLSNTLSDYLGDSKNNKLKKAKIVVKRNDMDGYYMNLSKPRAEILKTNLESIESISIKDIEIRIEDLKFNSNNKNNTKITIPSLNEKKEFKIEDYENENNDDNDHNKLIELVSYYYFIEIEKLYLIYGKYIKKIIPFISYCDFLKSNAKTASKYNYKKPQISYNSDLSFVNAINMRHPIIERLIDYEYVPHNVNLGTDLKGMLVYGVNSAGKTAIMKAVGLNIIMAQAGLYVPSSSFIYSPYESLFTRITGNDNLFKGLSSFTVEMIELKAIMKRSGPKTLVIGDEICRGTEHISGNAIVATSIINLAKSKSSFIFATHLHEIASMKRITELNNVKSFHISVEFDSKNNKLIYDRQLKPGPGEPIYGVIVAKYIIGDPEFNKLASEIKTELLNEYSGVTSGITSKYNSKLLIDECKLCGKKNVKSHISPLETHHINFQKDCVDGFIQNKPHMRKNDLANLVVLCTECHDKLHAGEFKIDGYVMTSSGKSLQVTNKNNTLLICGSTKLNKVNPF